MDGFGFFPGINVHLRNIKNELSSTKKKIQNVYLSSHASSLKSCVAFSEADTSILMSLIVSVGGALDVFDVGWSAGVSSALAMAET